MLPAPASLRERWESALCPGECPFSPPEALVQRLLSVYVLAWMFLAQHSPPWQTPSGRGGSYTMAATQQVLNKCLLGKEMIAINQLLDCDPG